MGDLAELKQVLRSLVVSSPTQIDMRMLLKDYRNMVGSPLPYFKHGYKDPVSFLQERCNDCFVLRGQPSNPVITLIVTSESKIKHIDAFVRKQKVTSSKHHKVKRQSINQPVRASQSQAINSYTNQPKSVQKQEPEQKHVEAPKHQVTQKHVETPKHQVTQKHVETPKHQVTQKHVETPKHQITPKQEDSVQKTHMTQNIDKENMFSEHPESTNDIVHRFLRKRIPLYSSSQYLEEEEHAERTLSDSGRQTLSSMSSGKRTRLEELREEVYKIIQSHPEGVACKDLLKLYRDKHSCELNFSKYGCNSIVKFIQHISSVTVECEGGAWLARTGAPPPLGAPRPRPRPRPALGAAPQTPDPDDALPGIDYDPDVFPPDCISFLESVPPAEMPDLVPGAMFGVLVGEVYSPSHFWIIRLGDQYNIAMEQLMDDMNEYYNSPEGRSRRLAVGAMRVGGYCSALYAGDWHRCLIVQLLDSDTVKVRHIDYGTVETVPAVGLRPLLLRYCGLGAQARRGRLAGARPGARGRRWPFPACRAFLDLVQDTALVANVLSVHSEDQILEILLINTSTSEDISITTQLILNGHADPRPDSALQSGESYLYPRFDALETGATPNFAEIAELLRRGLVLDCVDSYRRHVPASLPPENLDRGLQVLDTLIIERTPPKQEVATVPVPPEIPEHTITTSTDQPPKSNTQDTAPPKIHTVTPSTHKATPNLHSNPPNTQTSNKNNTPQAQIPPSFVKRQNIAAPQPRFYPPVPTPLSHTYSQILQPPQGFPMMSPFPNSVPQPYFYGPGPLPRQMPPAPMFNPCQPLMPTAPVFTPHHQTMFYQQNKPFSPSSSSSSYKSQDSQQRSPPPPYNASSDNVNSVGSRFIQSAAGNVTLSASDCEIFSILSQVDANKAHKYIMDVIQKAAKTEPSNMSPNSTLDTTSCLNPNAAEFRFVTTETQTDNVCVGDLISFDESKEDENPAHSLNPAVRNFLQSIQNVKVSIPPGFEPEDE